MNNNGNNLRQPKSINRIIAPIKVDGTGATLEEQKQIVEEQQIEINKQVQGKKEEVKEQVNIKKIKEHDSTTMVFIVVLLIILAVLTAFIFFFILPRYLDVKNGKYAYNDKVINNISEEDKYYFRDFKLTDDEFVITDANFNVSQEFNINVKNAGNFLNIYVNNILVTTCNQLYNTVAVVDDLIIMAIKNNQLRTTKVIAVDINGNIIKEFYNIGDSDGLVTLEQGNSFIVNSSSFVLITSRVIDTNLILSNEYGESDGIDICDKEELNKLNLEDNMLVMANFLIKYEGNHQFSSPTKIGDIKLKEYIDINKYCK